MIDARVVLRPRRSLQLIQAAKARIAKVITALASAFELLRVQQCDLCCRLRKALVLSEKWFCTAGTSNGTSKQNCTTALHRTEPREIISTQSSLRSGRLE